MWHTPVAHKVPSHTGYRREQAAPVTKPTGGPPVWRHIVLPIRAHVLNIAYLHPPTHPVYANYGYVFSFHNTLDPLALRNVPIKLCITITRNNFTTIIHTSTPTSTKKLHSSRAKVGLNISHQMHLYAKILRFYAHHPSRATSFKGAPRNTQNTFNPNLPSWGTTCERSFFVECFIMKEKRSETSTYIHRHEN